MHDVPVHGVNVDAHSRCAHWHSAVDIVAIRMKCCDRFFACNSCHDALTSHPIVPWGAHEFDTPAVRCGACAQVLTIRAYLHSGAQCAACAAPFNPRCALHHHHYFTLEPRS